MVTWEVDNRRYLAIRQPALSDANPHESGCGSRELNKPLDLESSKVIDLETFVPRAEVDPIYFNTPYYVYPDGRIADETFGVIGAAMREADKVGIGRVTLSPRERLVMIEPRDSGLVLITLRPSQEVRAASFATADTAIDPDMVAVASMIIKRRSGISTRPPFGTVIKKRCAS